MVWRQLAALRQMIWDICSAFGFSGVLVFVDVVVPRYTDYRYLQRVTNIDSRDDASWLVLALELSSGSLENGFLRLRA